MNEGFKLTTVPSALLILVFASLTFVTDATEAVSSKILDEDALITATSTSVNSIFAWLTFIGGLAWNCFYVFGTIPQYYPQMKDIRAGKGEGFSPWLCWILLTANVIRIFYWFAEPFETVLLGQSIVMVCVQLAMLHSICYAKEQKMVKSGKPMIKKTIQDMISNQNPALFWKWDDFNSYVTYTGTLIATLSMLCAAFLPSPRLGAFLGYSGLAIEACLGLPQLYRNYTKGTEGLSAFLIWTWLIGDIAKTVFFVILGAPLPFMLCGIFQIFTDILILAQIYLSKTTSSKTE